MVPGYPAWERTEVSKTKLETTIVSGELLNGQRNGERRATF